MNKKFFSFFLIMGLLLGSVNSQQLFFENFDNVPAGDLPTGWIAYGDTLTNHHTYSTFNQNWQVWFFDGVGKNGEAMTVTFTTDINTPCSRWLITPAITIPSGKDYALLFKYRDVVYGTLDVMISTTGTDTADFVKVGQATLQSDQRTFHYLLSDYADSTIHVAFVNRNTHGNCSQYAAIDDVEIKDLPENDIDLLSVNMPSTIQLGDTLKATLTFMPVGIHRIDFFDCTITCGNQAPVQHNVEASQGHPYWPYTQYTITESIVPDAAGTYIVSFVLDNPNGVSDPTPSSNIVRRQLSVVSDPVGVSSVSQQQVKIDSDKGMIIIDGCNNSRVAVYSADGRLVASHNAAFGSISFQMPHKGVYIVRVGNLPTRKVVVF